MASNSEGFVGRIVGVVVGVIVVGAVAIPIVNGLTTGDTPTIDPNSTVGTIINILPVFLVLAILLMIVKLFYGRAQ